MPATFPLFPLLPTELRLKIWSTTLPSSRIVKISYSPSQSRYISNIAPPITLSINRESRDQALHEYSFLYFGPSPASHHRTIPINFKTDSLYISNLAPILTTHLHSLLYNLATSGSRHSIRSLAIDRRVWNDLCENGLLMILCRMRELTDVCMVVEFGRTFGGELGFLSCPEWRGDLRWLAEQACTEVEEERKKWAIWGGVGNNGIAAADCKGFTVRCVILTRGGEQA